MSKDNFQWDDKLVIEFATKWMRERVQWALLHDFAAAPPPIQIEVEDFKASHQPKEQSNEWEIVEGCAKGGAVHEWLNDNSHGGESCWQQKCEIHSVRRISDGVVFSVGDEVEYNHKSEGKIKFKIKSIGIVNGNDCVVWSNHREAFMQSVPECSISSLKKLPPNKEPQPFQMDKTFWDEFKIYVELKSGETNIRQPSSSINPDKFLHELAEDKLLKSMQPQNNKERIVESLWGEWLDNLVDEIPKRKSIIKEILLGEKYYSQQQLEDAKRDAFKASREKDVYGISGQLFPKYPTFESYINSQTK